MFPDDECSVSSVTPDCSAEDGVGCGTVSLFTPVSALFSVLAAWFLGSASSVQGKRKNKFRGPSCFENDRVDIVNGRAEEAATQGPVGLLVQCSPCALAATSVNQKVR